MDTIQIIALILGGLLFIFTIYIGYVVIFQRDEGIRKASAIIDSFIDSGKVNFLIVYGILLGIGLYFLINLLMDFFIKIIK